MGPVLLRQLRVGSRKADGKPVSQRDVEKIATRVGTGNLSKYESGAIPNPSFETLSSIIKAIDTLRADGVPYPDHVGIMTAYGYVFPSPQTCDRARSLVIRQIGDRVKALPYPAYLLDNTFTPILKNTDARKLSGIEEGSDTEILVMKTPLFKSYFHPQIRLADLIVNRDEFLRIAIRLLKADFLRFEKPAWLEALFQEACDESKEFNELWQSVELDSFSPLIDQSTIPIIINGPAGSHLTFNVFLIPYTRDSRFTLVRYMPVNFDTMAFFTPDSEAK